MDPAAIRVLPRGHISGAHLLAARGSQLNLAQSPEPCGNCLRATRIAHPRLQKERRITMSQREAIHLSPYRRRDTYLRNTAVLWTLERRSGITSSVGHPNRLNERASLLRPGQKDGVPGGQRLGRGDCLAPSFYAGPGGERVGHYHPTAAYWCSGVRH